MTTPKPNSPELETLRNLARYKTHGGYVWAAVMSDGECLCIPCVRANYRQIFRATRDPRDHSGWKVIGLDSSDAADSAEYCAHCHREIWAGHEEA